jgi:hypothetical protein
MGIQPVYGERGCFMNERTVEKRQCINIFKLGSAYSNTFSMTLRYSGGLSYTMRKRDTDSGWRPLVKEIK